MSNRVSIVITEDILTLMKTFKVERISDAIVGLNNYDMFPLSNPRDFIALVLGHRNDAIKGTEESIFGATYSEEVEKKLNEIGGFLIENLLYLEEILHQFCDVGVKPGRYTCSLNNRIWQYKEIAENFK